LKNFAKLVLFFCFSFIGVLLVSSLFALFHEGTRLAVLFPPAGASLSLLSHLGNSLSVAFYLSILLTLSYASRRRLAYPVVFALILALALVLSSGAFVGIDSLAQLGKFSINVTKSPANMVQPGLILKTGSPIREVHSVFLEDPLKQGGPRAVSPAGQALYYQRQGATLTRAPLPFAEEKSALFESISRDFTQSSKGFSSLFTAGFLPYWMYAGSLAIFLISLGCLVNISFWPLANLFFAALVFRGALALETFLNQPNIRGLLGSFAGNRVPGSLINPFIFCMLGVLILLYSGLLYLARGRVSNG